MSLLSTHPLGHSRLDTITPLSIWFSLLAAPIAFGVVSVLTPGVIAIARWRGWVARPSIDRWHRKTTALMGGIAIYLGTVAAMLLLARRQVMPAFAAAASMMFLAGCIDDRKTMSPAAKIIVQLVASAVFVANGHFFDIAASRWFTVPLTVFWLLGITNGVNLIDNMDGLAAGVGAIAAMALGGMALIAKAPALAVVAFAIAGSAAGFLLFNFQPARIFMGDCGSLFLGFALASLAVMVQNTLEIRGLLAVLMIAMILGIPILDTTLVTIIRTLNGRSISQGGRDHTSHRLVALGLSDRQAVLLLYAAAAVFGLLGVVFYLSDVRLRISIIIFAFLAAGLLGAELGAENVYQKPPAIAYNGHSPILVRVLQLPRAIFGPQLEASLCNPGGCLDISCCFYPGAFPAFRRQPHPIAPGISKTKPASGHSLAASGLCYLRHVPCSLAPCRRLRHSADRYGSNPGHCSGICRAWASSWLLFVFPRSAVYRLDGGHFGSNHLPFRFSRT